MTDVVLTLVLNKCLGLHCTRYFHRIVGWATSCCKMPLLSWLVC